MKHYFLLVLACILIGCQPNEKKQDSGKDATAHQPKKEKKSFIFSTWITYDPQKTDEQYSEEFRKYKENGITEVLVNTLTNPKDLERLVPIARKEKVVLHAWIMAVNRPDDKEALQHPEWYMVSREGKSCFDHRPYVEYYQWLCPTRKESRQHILDLVEGLAKVEGIASVHLDYIRFPDIFLPIGLLPTYDNLVQNEELPQYDFCYCDVCIAEFEKIHHKNPKEMEHPNLDIEWREFRFNKIRSIVNEAYEIAHKNGKQLTAAVFPYSEMAGSMVRQRWDKWNIDRVYPMIYQNFYNEELDWVGYATKQGVEDLQPKKTELFTGIYLSPLSAEQLKEAITYAHKNGANGVSFYDGNAFTDEQLKVIKELAGKLEFY